MKKIQFIFLVVLLTFFVSSLTFSQKKTVKKTTGKAATSTVQTKCDPSTMKDCKMDGKGGVECKQDAAKCTDASKCTKHDPAKCSDPSKCTHDPAKCPNKTENK